MSNGEIAFLGLVLFAFMAFIGTVGFVSIWSRKKGPKDLPAQHTRMAEAAPALRRAA
jgi:hypothetical protein